MDNQQRVQSVVAANQILEALATRGEGSSLTELARLLDMTPSRVLRHLTTLVDLQLVERTGTEPIYRLGIGLVRLAERAAYQHDVGRVALPALRRLNDVFGQATYLVRKQGGRASVWLSFESDGLPHLAMSPGMSFSLSGSASGRVLLAFDPDASLDVPLAAKPRHDFPDPIPTRKALEERLKQIRQIFFDQHSIGHGTAIYGLAAPLLGHDDRTVAAIGLGGFSVQLPGRAGALLRALLETAEEVSRQLGSRREWPKAAARAEHAKALERLVAHYAER